MSDGVTQDSCCPSAAGLALARRSRCWPRCRAGPRRPSRPGAATSPASRRGRRAAAACSSPRRPIRASRAQFEMRLGQLEEELRRLTGRLEQLEFGQRTLESRIDQLVQDLDVRLAPSSRARATRRRGAGPSSRAGAGGRGAGAGRAARSRPGPGSAAGAGSGAAGARSACAGERAARPAASRPGRGDAAREHRPPAQRQYDSAMELLRAGDYTERGARPRAVPGPNPDHPLASNAAYWLAETLLCAQGLRRRGAGFARNYQHLWQDRAQGAGQPPQARHGAVGLGEPDKACQTYAELAKEFPNAPTHIEQAVGRERAAPSCS